LAPHIVKGTPCLTAQLVGVDIVYDVLLLLTATASLLLALLFGAATAEKPLSQFCIAVIAFIRPCAEDVPCWPLNQRGRDSGDHACSMQRLNMGALTPFQAIKTIQLPHDAAGVQMNRMGEFTRSID
jgi:hypothetical protein